MVRNWTTETITELSWLTLKEYIAFSVKRIKQIRFETMEAFVHLRAGPICWCWTFRWSYPPCCYLNIQHVDFLLKGSGKMGQLLPPEYLSIITGKEEGIAGLGATATGLILGRLSLHLNFLSDEFGVGQILMLPYL